MFDLNLTSVKLKNKKESIPELPQHISFLCLWDLKKCYLLVVLMLVWSKESGYQSYLIFRALLCLDNLSLKFSFPFFFSLVVNLLPTAPNEKSNTLNSSSPKEERNQFPIFFGKSSLLQFLALDLLYVL